MVGLLMGLCGCKSSADDAPRPYSQIRLTPEEMEEWEKERDIRQAGGIEWYRGPR
ncbi:MAG: hypothetical protein S4CHLAM45_14360 [Chlamydiales bacterium]|nr:hypothetical protein [Chlamydiales bacterium]MCH9620055.1 hypothetical protein [Chlamydiales bacterium]MCH9623526.1 hypothetical protein [Chlamydiales bacterium]